MKDNRNNTKCEHAFELINNVYLVYEFESIIKSHMSPFKEPTSKERDKELNKQNNKRQKKLNWKEKKPAKTPISLT